MPDPAAQGAEERQWRLVLCNRCEQPITHCECDPDEGTRPISTVPVVPLSRVQEVEAEALRFRELLAEVARSHKLTGDWEYIVAEAERRFSERGSRLEAVEEALREIDRLLDNDWAEDTPIDLRIEAIVRAALNPTEQRG